MYSQTAWSRKVGRFSSLLLAIAGLMLFSFPSLAQTTVSTGSIVGTVTDPSGAVVSGAKVAITNAATGRAISLKTNQAGFYNSGALDPGNYRIEVGAKGFSKVSIPVTVLVGNTATANAKLAVGQESQVVEVQASEVQVNTEQPTVQGVLNAQQIDNLPINGRNFLDLAQLEPGVQIQDGQNFDPTKAGYSSISFGGRFGRTARITVDGVDVSDETVGTTTEDIPSSAIQEFQLSQSTLDLSNDLTSSGAVNVTTRSGTNSFHGEAFDYFRDSSMAASLPVTPGFKAPFQSSQFGGRFGGPVIKNKLFFFMDAERTKQDAVAPVSVSAPLEAQSGTFNQGFRETNVLGKVDYQLGNNARMFYRFSYFANKLPATFGLGFSVYDNKDYTRNHVIGLDFNTGSFTHSIRYSYLKFQNQIVDATVGSGLPFAGFPSPTARLEFRIRPTFFVGPNLLAPQSTPQANHQLKYDGSKILGAHILRYGASYNHIQGGGFADFFGLAPEVRTKSGTSEVNFANTLGPFPGGASNPLNYPVEEVLVGNGLGFNTLEPALGFPAGGLGPDNRIGLYAGDNWKIKPNFTLTYGLRYDRDTGRTDSDLPAIPEINSVFPGMGNAVKQPNTNFAPQAGFAWDPTGSGKTVIRGGGGLFYENVIYNNVLFDRPLRLRTGAFNQVQVPCFSGQALPIPVPGGSLTPGQGLASSMADMCGNSGTGNLISIGQAASEIVAFQKLYQSLNPFNLQAPNPNFVGNFLGSGISLPIALFAPNYKTPRSLQMNIGVQRQLRQGMVFSADFMRNVETHTLLGVDMNHVGDARYFNRSAAMGAINATNTSFGCPAGVAGINCAIQAGAMMSDYAGNGLTSPGLDFGGVCPFSYGCAFAGINPTAPQGFFLFPIGRSVYNGLQMKLVQNVSHPMRGVRNLNFQVSYSLSRFENSGGVTTGGQGGNDQDFVIQATDNNAPNRYFGPSLLDRTHQISFGGYLDLPGGFRTAVIGHFYSPLASGMFVSNTFNTGEIFRTDFTGDGTVGDPAPGTNIGSFDRGINAAGLNNFINNYNNTVAGQATPAGKTLISSGLFTLAQLQALQGVAPTVPTAPAGQVNMDWLRSFDLNLAWRHTFKEKLTIEPGVAFFNVFNFANFNLPPNTMSNVMDGSSGSINGTDYAGNFPFRVGNGTGVYALGAPRQISFSLKLDF